MKAKQMMIVQGGGPTAVFNASLAGAIEEAASSSGFSAVWGARCGSHGLSRGDVTSLNGMGAGDLATLRDTPGAALGTSRFKPSADDLAGQLATLRSLDAHSVLFLGGNGSMLGAQVLGEYCNGNGFEVNVIGVPKTVDNDLAGTDRCPGYASAARYVIQSTKELGLDVRSLPQPVTILETMGRSVGWLAAAASMAAGEEGDAPHLIYLPEVPFEQDAFLAALDEFVTRQGWAVVVVAEGIRNKDGSMVFESNDPGQQDALQRPLTGGVARYLSGVVSRELRIRCRSEKPGLLGRASMAHLSQHDQKDAVSVGAAGVKALLAGETGKMVSLPSLASGSEECGLVPLAEVAGVERAVPAAWLSGGPLAVSDEFRKYLRPLVGNFKHHAPTFARVPLVMGTR